MSNDTRDIDANLMELMELGKLVVWTGRIDGDIAQTQYLVIIICHAMWITYDTFSLLNW